MLLLLLGSKCPIQLQWVWGSQLPIAGFQFCTLPGVLPITFCQWSPVILQPSDSLRAHGAPENATVFTHLWPSTLSTGSLISTAELNSLHLTYLELLTVLRKALWVHLAHSIRRTVSWQGRHEKVKQQPSKKCSLVSERVIQKWKRISQGLQTEVQMGGVMKWYCPADFLKDGGIEKR